MPKSLFSNFLSLQFLLTILLFIAPISSADDDKFPSFPDFKDWDSKICAPVLDSEGCIRRKQTIDKVSVPCCFVNIQVSEMKLDFCVSKYDVVPKIADFYYQHFPQGYYAQNDDNPFLQDFNICLKEAEAKTRWLENLWLNQESFMAKLAKNNTRFNGVVSCLSKKFSKRGQNIVIKQVRCICKVFKEIGFVLAGLIIALFV